jgi:hypothetical protein
MPKISKKEEEKFEIPVREYSDNELRKFHDLAQKYYQDVLLQATGETIRALNQKAIMIAYGALSARGGVIPGRYTQFENLYEQWQAWKIRTGLDKGVARFSDKDRQLDAMAQEKTLDPIDEIPF